MPTFLHTLTLITLFSAGAFFLITVGATLLWLAEVLEQNPKDARRWGKGLIYVRIPASVFVSQGLVAVLWSRCVSDLFGRLFGVVAGCVCRSGAAVPGRLVSWQADAPLRPRPARLPRLSPRTLLNLFRSFFDRSMGLIRYLF